MKTDWQGRPVPENEDPNSTVLVWEVTPHPNGQYTHVVIRSWQDLNSFMTSVPEMYLDGASEEECRDGVAITIKLVPMQLHEYQEIEYRD